MGIYIKNMTLGELNDCIMAGAYIGEKDVVEVKAPHGRLIDESVLNERAKLWVTNFNLGMTLHEQLDEFYKVAEIPTVIEAEVE